MLTRAFLFLRHGRTAWNAERRVMGWTDRPLDATGRAQAERAAELLAGAGVASIYSSTLERARATADIVAARLGLPVIEVEGLQERGWGAREGHIQDEWPADDVPPDAENMAVFEARALASLASLDGPEPMLVVSHGGVLRVLKGLLGHSTKGRQPNAQPLWIDPVRRLIRPLEEG